MPDGGARGNAEIENPIRVSEGILRIERRADPDRSAGLSASRTAITRYHSGVQARGQDG